MLDHTQLPFSSLLLTSHFNCSTYTKDVSAKFLFSLSFYFYFLYYDFFVCFFFFFWPLFFFCSFSMYLRISTLYINIVPISSFTNTQFLSVSLFPFFSFFFFLPFFSPFCLYLQFHFFLVFFPLFSLFLLFSSTF